MVKQPTHLSQLGISPALFEAMAATAQPDNARVKLNKKKLRKEIKMRKNKNLIKGAR